MEIKKTSLTRSSLVCLIFVILSCVQDKGQVVEIRMLNSFHFRNSKCVGVIEHNGQIFPLTMTEYKDSLEGGMVRIYSPASFTGMGIEFSYSSQGVLKDFVLEKFSDIREDEFKVQLTPEKLQLNQLKPTKNTPMKGYILVHSDSSTVCAIFSIFD